MHSSLLNGWRRLGIVIASLWIIAVIAVAAFECTSGSRGIFVYQQIPEGTIVAGNKVITLTEEDEFKVRAQAEQSMKEREQGHIVPPWELDWTGLEAVPKIIQIRWLRLAAVTLLVPLIAWLLTEALMLTVSWVRRGFMGTKRDD